MSAPPDSSAPQNQSFKMSGQNHQEHSQHPEQHSNVRHIPIFVEGRDEPVINRSVDHGAHYGESKPAYQSPPQQQPHIDRDQYFADDGPVSFHHPPNFSRAFGTPFNKGFRQGPQPFVQQKVYPQAAYTRGASPHRSQSPKPQPHPDEHYIKVPVHHEQNAAKTEPPSRTQQRQAPPQQHQSPPQPQPPKQQHPQQHRQSSPQPQAGPREQTPPQPKQQTPANDPITIILSIQTDVLNLMTEVENFTGTKKDKKYLFLDEMLTRNLIKLDNIETDGKENIRQARKEAIKCIQKCIAVLEAKAESNNTIKSEAPSDVEMKENTEATEPLTANGEVETKEPTKEQEQSAPQPAEVAKQEEVKSEAQTHEEPNKMEEQTNPTEETPEVKEEPKHEATVETKVGEVVETQAADTRPEDNKTEQPNENTEQKDDTTKSPKSKVVKKRNKSKDNKKDVPNDSNKQENEDSSKEPKQAEENDKVDVMQVDDKGDKESQKMEVDGAASQ